MRLHLRLIPLLAALAAMAFTLSPARADDAGDARKFIEQAAATVRADASNGVPAGEQQKRFAVVLDRDFDVTTIGRFVLGRYWANASEQSRQDFISAFRGFLAKSYAPRFFTYAGRPMTVTGARSGNDGAAVVRTEVDDVNNRKVGVDWHVTHNTGAPRIVDVVVEGVSLAQTQRDDFGAYLSANSGDVGKLASLLRQRSQ